MRPEPVEWRLMASHPSAVCDLHHHGDRDVAEGLIDLAVNVRLKAPPAWLSAIINGTIQDLAAYPDTDSARKAIAEAHGVAVDQVLPTAGGAEAFTLLARAIRAERPLIIHPQFTEPEVALLPPDITRNGSSCRLRQAFGSTRSTSSQTPILW
mgnify:CR=1 FL=1